MEKHVELNWPNANIFQEYGKLDDPNSILSKSQIIFIRHGYSEYNSAAVEFREKNLL